MVKKSLGYVHLEWTCPRCGTRNLGKQVFCIACGGPQPEDVEFEQAAQETLIEDEADLARAKAGPDLHCPYCHARNPGEAKFCGACGADLAEAQARQAGQVVGAHKTGVTEATPPLVCPACGTSNPADAVTCAQCGLNLRADQPKESQITEPPKKRSKAFLPILAVLGLLCIAAVIVIVIMSGKTEQVVGQVEMVEWSRTMLILELGPVEYEDWLDEIPAGAQIGDCTLEYRYDSDEPVANSVEVCGTPYTEDTGSGYGEVVQDCVYEVSEDRCTYTVEEWSTVDQVTLTHHDVQPEWPQPTLFEGQRMEQGDERYTVVFDTNGKQYEYSVSDPGTFSQFTPGSQWSLNINAFDQIRSVEPAD